MGYNLTIGNAVAETLQCEDGEYIVRIDVNGHTSPDAPADGSPTDRTSDRWPSYSAWRDFCTESGLNAMFYDGYRGLLRKHPGVFAIEQSHLLEVKAAHERLKEGPAAIYELQKGRIAWLEYWIHWALNNCERPAIRNS